MIFPNLQNCACYEKYLKDNKHNSLHLARKYAQRGAGTEKMEKRKYDGSSRKNKIEIYGIFVSRESFFSDLFQPYGH